MANFPVTLSWEQDQVDLDARALWLRRERDYHFQQIADEMGEALSTVHMRVRRAYARLPGPTAAEQKAADLAECAELSRLGWEVAEATHLIVSDGHVVTVKVGTDEDGEDIKVPVPDHAPKLAAGQFLLKVQERRAKAVGSDAPTKRSYEVLTKDAFVASMEEMVREMESGDVEGGLR